MPPYPDLGASGAKYVQLSLHVTGGLEKVEAFWRPRLEAHADRLALAGYTRNGRAHTIAIDWSPVHANCANVFITVWPERPGKTFPGIKLRDHRLRTSDFLAFVDLIRTLELFRGIRVRYAFPWRRGPLITALSPNIRVISLSFEAVDEKDKKPVLRATQRRVGGEWEVILEPVGRLELPDSAAKLFVEPSEVVSALARTIRKEMR